jgi:ferric enterobactin receptor
VEPRLRVNYHLSPRLQLKGGCGTYHQVINRIGQEDLSQGDREFWVLSDGDRIPVSNSRQIVVGGSYENQNFLVDVELYHKSLNDLTLFAPRLTAGVIPGEGASYLYYGGGIARGLETLFQKKFGTHTGWVSYTLSRIQQSFPTLEATRFPASQDQTHEVKVADSAKVGERWTVGMSWAFGTGRPYTPATGIESVELPIGITVDRLTFGAKNSDRLPAYHRLDVSTQGDFRIWGAKSTLGVTVFNLYDRTNVWYRSYQTFGGSGAVNDVLLMGRAINVFFRFGF